RQPRQRLNRFRRDAVLLLEAPDRLLGPGNIARHGRVTDVWDDRPDKKSECESSQAAVPVNLRSHAIDTSRSSFSIAACCSFGIGGRSGRGLPLSANATKRAKFHAGMVLYPSQNFGSR